jgi:hypothetical protein
MTETALTLDETLEAGFFGESVDPTPNHAYTVAGVGAGEATPETDPKAKEAATARRDELAARFSDTAAAKPAAKRSTKAESS